MNVAETILSQLGGRRFAVMTGAKQFVGGDRLLQFGLPARAAKAGINKVRVTLDPSDTYSLAFYKVRGMDVQPVDERSGVYADDLRRVFRDVTGLDTHL